MKQTQLAAGILLTDVATGEAFPPALVLVHGAGGTHRHWPEELRALPGRRVVSLDLPGHGGSASRGRPSVAGYARSVLEALDELGVASAVMGGHSMGGAVALSLALDAPGRVEGLVLVGTGARLRVSPAALEATADPGAAATAAQVLAEVSFGAGAGEALRRELAEAYEAAAPGLVHGDLLACDAFDVMDRLGEIHVPTLVVCGAEDRMTPPKYARFLRDRVAGARLELVPGAGHMVMLERPAAVATAVGAFLDGLRDRRTRLG